MAGKLRVDLNPAGVRKLLCEQSVLADLRARAERIASAAGDGHEVHADIGKTRARAVVITTSYDAMYEEATSRELTRAVDAGRG